MATIIGGITWEDTFEDMVELALFPPSSQYSTFDVTFGTTRRLKGTEDFRLYGSTSTYPLIAWKCVSTYINGWFAAQSPRWHGRVSIGFCQSGPTDIDNATRAAHQQLVRWQAEASEALVKQNAGTGYTDGAFFRQNAGVSALGVAILGVGDITITPGEPVKDTTLGADVWTLRMFVDIDVAAGPGA